MAKPRAQGSDAVLLLAKEVTYGTAVSGVAGGVYFKPPMRSDSVSGAQPLEADETWNKGTPEDGDASLGAFTVAGDLVVPMDARGIGYFMTMALGAEAEPEEADDLFIHTWKSGADLFSYTKQVGHPKLVVPKWRTQLGCKSNGFSFPMSRTGRALLTLPLIAQGEVKDVGGARDVNPDTYDYLPFDNAKGSVEIGGVAVANLTGGQFNFSNGLDAVDAIRSDFLINGADETIRTCSGTANLRLGTDATIDDLVDAHTPAALEFAFALASDAAWLLKFTLPRVFFEKTPISITGPGGIEMATTWRAARDEGEGYLLKVELTNDVAAYA